MGLPLMDLIDRAHPIQVHGTIQVESVGMRVSRIRSILVELTSCVIGDRTHLRENPCMKLSCRFYSKLCCRSIPKPTALQYEHPIPDYITSLQACMVFISGVVLHKHCHCHSLRTCNEMTDNLLPCTMIPIATSNHV